MRGAAAHYSYLILGGGIRELDPDRPMGVIGPEADPPYAHLPFFYSDLFDLGNEAVGALDPRAETVAGWKVPFHEGVVYHLAAGRVRGVLLWKTWGQVDAARNLIEQPGPFGAADLTGRLPS